MNSDDSSTAEERETARTLAKSGAQLGASAGGRLGPVATGLASGLGGAVGYLAGAAVDDVRVRLERPIADGGRPGSADPAGDADDGRSGSADGDADEAVDIAVVEEP